MFRLWFVIGNFLCTIDSTVEVEAIGLVLLGSYNKCLPFSSANSEAYAHYAPQSETDSWRDTPHGQ